MQKNGKFQGSRLNLTGNPEGSSSKKNRYPQQGGQIFSLKAHG